MQEAPFLRKYGFRYGFFGKNIQKLYVFPALCGHRLIKFPPAVGQSAYEGHIFDFVVALIAVALEKAVQLFIKRQEVMFGAVNAPVCHCLPGRRQAKLGRQGFLPVIRQP